MRRIFPVFAVGAAAAYLIAFRLGEDGPGRISFDTYFYFYPHMLHALRSFAAGGSGLLWNPYQNCGQPFFANIETGLIYPLNLLFLVLEPQTALRGVLFGNLVIGGLGAYGLVRELGASRMAATVAALAFVLSASTYHVTLWMPTVQAPYVWMPVTMWCCERLVKAPSFGRALVLGLALAVSLLPGHPQFVLFGCQMIALRLLWSAFDGSERKRLPRVVGGTVVAFSVMLLLGAVQYLPSLELVAESVRGAGLRPKEIEPAATLTPSAVARDISEHRTLAPFAIVPATIAAAAIASLLHRRAALFYLLAGGLFLALAFGNATPLGRLYYETPPGHMFRQPIRFGFITGFCVAVVTGLGADTLARGAWAPLVVSLATLFGLRAGVGPLSTSDWALVAGMLGASVLAAFKPIARPIAPIAILAAVVLVPVLLPPVSLVRFIADDTPLDAHAAVFERLRKRATPQDRVHLARPHGDIGFQDKSATRFRLRATTDYELQLTRRYAEFLVMMLKGQELTSVNQIYFLGKWNPGVVKWPLMHLTAARYIVTPRDPGGAVELRKRRITRIDGEPGVAVYSNPAALPRAYYVAQIAAVPDAALRLRRLASGNEDRRRLALVDRAPAPDFLGVSGNDAVADLTFVVDDPERVVLEGVAPERGFAFLADQYFPGWSATVNGQPAPILVGNHAFRLVEVPKGPVTVEFRYRPRRVWIGALISGISLAVVIALLVRTFRRGG